MLFSPVRPLGVPAATVETESLHQNFKDPPKQYIDSSGEYQNQFYYIDLVQEDGEKAISSPVWINRAHQPPSSASRSWDRGEEKGQYEEDVRKVRTIS